MSHSKFIKEIPELLRDLEARPLRVAVEPSSACNSNCTFCANKYCERNRAILDFDTYKKAVHQIKELGCDELKFTPIIGEVFVDPGFIEKVKYAKSLNYFKVIYTFSNMIAAHRHGMEEIITSGLTQLMISTCLQGREDYKRIYGVDQFEQVMNNILNLLRANKKHGNPLDISIWLRHDKDFNLSTSKYYRTLTKYTSKIHVLNDDYDNWSGLVKQQDLPYGQKFKAKKDNTFPCAQYYNGLVVSPTGEVGICWARDTNLNLKVGDIKENHLRDIWQSQALKDFRNRWLRGDIPYPCNDCLQYCSILEHSLIQKHILRHPQKYPTFLPTVFKAKIAQIKERAEGYISKLKARA